MADDFGSLRVGRSGLDQLSESLQGEEGRMAFVGMPDYRSQSQGTECPHTADSEQDLLAEAEFLVSAVQSRGKGAVARRIVWHVGVEQVQGDPPHTNLPDQGRHGPAPHFYLDLAGSARWGQGLLDRRI